MPPTGPRETCVTCCERTCPKFNTVFQPIRRQEWASAPAKLVKGRGQAALFEGSVEDSVLLNTTLTLHQLHSALMTRVVSCCCGFRVGRGGASQ